MVRLHNAGTAVLLVWVGFRSSGLASQAVTAGPASLATITDEVQRQLGSDDPKDVAWGAYLAAQNQLRSAVPLLEERLASVSTDDSLPTALAILDALIRLDATLPAQTLRSSFDRCPIQALILLANASSGRDEMLLSLLESTSGFRWQAAANFLLMTKPPGFARRLLAGLHLRLAIYVTDQHNVGFGSGLGRGVGKGGNVEYVAPGFPPLADYQFATAVSEATILSSGPRAVYYIRRILNPPGTYRPHAHKTADGSWEDDSDSTTWLNLDRVQYIDRLATDRSDEGPLHEETSRTLLWTNAEDLRRQVAEQRRQVEAVYGQVVSLLVTRGYLTGEEARTVLPDIQITLSDKRNNKSESLPRIQ
jgi:hypothetical protein